MILLDGIKDGMASLRQAANTMAHRRTATLGSMAIDAAFLFTLGVILEYFGSKIVDTLLAIGVMMIPQSAVSPDSFAPTLFGGAAQGLELQAAILIMMMTAGTFLAFCILEGSSWMIVYNLAGKKMNYLHFIALFTRVSGAFFPAYLLYEGLGFLHDFSIASIERMPGSGVWDPGYIAPVIGIATAYFSIGSLSRLDEGTASGAIKSGLRRVVARQFIWRFIPIFILIIPIELVLRAALGSGRSGQAMGIFLLLASLTLTKTALLISISKDA